jgi:hypothetical protein
MAEGGAVAAAMIRLYFRQEGLIFISEIVALL